MIPHFRAICKWYILPQSPKLLFKHNQPHIGNAVENAGHNGNFGVTKLFGNTKNQLKTVQKIEHSLAYMDYAKIFLSTVLLVISIKSSCGSIPFIGVYPEIIAAVFDGIFLVKLNKRRTIAVPFAAGSMTSVCRTITCSSAVWICS